MSTRPPYGTRPYRVEGLGGKGRKDTIPVNYSGKSLHIIGALGDDTLDIQFHGNLKADSYVDLIEYACRRHKKIGIMADNTGALASNTMKDYVYGTDGTVEILHIRTPHAATKPHRDTVARDKDCHSRYFLWGVG